MTTTISRRDYWIAWEIKLIWTLRRMSCKFVFPQVKPGPIYEGTIEKPGELLNWKEINDYAHQWEAAAQAHGNIQHIKRLAAWRKYWADLMIETMGEE